jgi:hypothetical protein
MTTKNLALAASIMMLATISGQALAGTAAPKAQYWRAATGRSDHQGGTRLQCCRSADGDTDDGAQCARLSWRTEIQRLIRTTLNGSGRLPWLDCIRRQQRNGPSLGVEAGAEV